MVVAVCLLLPGLGCGKKKKEPQMNPYSDRYASGESRYMEGLDQLEAHKLSQAVKTLSAINQYTSGNRREIEPLVRLAMADATFYQNTDISLIDARSLYLDFVSLYNSHPLAPYAQFQAGICSLKQVNHSSRDQTETYQALSDFREVFARWPESVFADAADLKTREAERQLAAHEVLVGKFYIGRKRYQAAIERLRWVLKTFPDYENTEEVYFYLAKALMKAENTSEARIYLDKLVTDYPGGDYYKDALKRLEAAGGQLETSVATQAQANGETP
jgi:outer membrane protein assembly factor BamD